MTHARETHSADEMAMAMALALATAMAMAMRDGDE